MAAHELVECTITHTRLRPKKYRFETSFFWFGIDLFDTKNLHKEYSSRCIEQTLYLFPFLQ